MLGFLVLVFLGLAAPRWLERRSRTVCPKWRADVMSIEFAAEEFAHDHAGRWPAQLADLLSPGQDGHPYIERGGWLADPWKRPYQYEPPRDPGDPPRIWTLGRDGKPGGSGEDEDCGNWMLHAPSSVDSGR